MMKHCLAILLVLLLGACVPLQPGSGTNNGRELSGTKDLAVGAPEHGGKPEAETLPDLQRTPDSPLSPEDAYERGLADIAAGRFEAAAVTLKRLTEYDPNDARANYALGFAYLRLGEYEDAMLHFTRSHAGATDAGMQTKALVARGYALHVLGRYRDAIKAYGVALQISPNNAKALYNRGCTYGEMGEYDKAVADFEQVLRLDPEYPGARNNLRFYSGRL